MSKLKSVNETLAALVRAGVQLALTRNTVMNEVEETGKFENLDEDQIACITDDAANAVQGVDCCEEQPIPEFMNAIKALRDYKPEDKNFFRDAAKNFLETWMDSSHEWQEWQIEAVADLIKTTMRDFLRVLAKKAEGN